MTNDIAFPKILVVDDEPLIRSGIARCLEGRAEVVTTDNAEEAIIELGLGNYDLCIMDVFLPGMDGVAAMKRINQIAPSTKVVIMTGSYLTDAMKEIIEQEAYAFIEKPFNIARIREVASGVSRGSQQFKRTFAGGAKGTREAAKK